MIYEYSIEVAANTAEANKQRRDITLPRGVVHRVEVEFPEGCAGLAHLIVRRGTHQMYPSNADDSFNSNGRCISFRDHYKLMYKSNRAQVYTWNLDDTYTHTVTLRLGVLPEYILIPEKAWERVIKSMQKLFGL